MVGLDQILAARERIAGRVHRTPLLGSTALSALAGARVQLKAELFQKTGSFKVRGVFNRIALLSEAERDRGLITISAGNHAQAVAYASGVAGVRATVVMPASANAAKVAASREYGAEVVLHGDVFGAFAKMHELREERGLTLVHPFDDEGIIAGHATVGLEIIEDEPAADLVLVPVGGGGLVSGIAAAVKALRPAARVVGVEPEGAACVRAGLDAGRVVRLERVLTIADGLAPPSSGEAPLEHIRALVDDVVTVEDRHIVEAMRLIYTRCKLVVEPSGAAGLAALIAGHVSHLPGDRTVIVLSGGNIDLERLKELF